MSDYLTKKAVQLYFDTVMQYNLRENDVTTFQRRDNVVIVNTKERMYVKSIPKELR